MAHDWEDPFEPDDERDDEGEEWKHGAVERASDNGRPWRRQVSWKCGRELLTEVFTRTGEYYCVRCGRRGGVWFTEDRYLCEGCGTLLRVSGTPPIGAATGFWRTILKQLRAAP